MYPAEILSEVPQKPGIYAFFQRYKGARTPCAYIGSSAAQGRGAGNLQSRLKQHLCAQTGTVSSSGRAVSINLDQLTDCSYWLHEKFSQKDYLHAAELIFQEVFKPVYRNQTNIKKTAFKIIDKDHQRYDADFVKEITEFAHLEKEKKNIMISLPSMRTLHRDNQEFRKRINLLEQTLNQLVSNFET